MQEFTFIINPEKQSPSVQQWLQYHEYDGADGFTTNYYHSEGMVYCHLLIDSEVVATRSLPYPMVYHILEHRFGWTQVGWFGAAFGQVFELTGEDGERLFIANSLNIDMNELCIDDEGNW